MKKLKTVLPIAGLIIGILLAFSCMLFFGRDQQLFSILLFTGVAIILLSYFLIAFGKYSKLFKVACTLAIIVVACAEPLIEPVLVKYSLRKYIKQNEFLLNEVNAILSTKHAVYITDRPIVSKIDTYTEAEKNRLHRALASLGLHNIRHMEGMTTFDFTPFMKIRPGIIYFSEGKEDGYFRHITGNWFY